MFGRWDEALERRDMFIAECEAGSPHYLESRMREARARLRAARGDVEGALADERRAVTAARSANDPQQVLPTLGRVSLAFETPGTPKRRSNSHVRLSRSPARTRTMPCLGLGLDFVFSRLALDFESELREALDDAPPYPWKELAFACLDRDFIRAAEMWAEAGSPTWEARSPLRAAEELIETGRHAEGEVELAKAIAFYGTVGATFFVQRGEALQAKSRTA